MKNKKCASGVFGVYHTGKMEYSVYDDSTDTFLDKRTNLSEAFSLANQYYTESKNGD